MKCGNCFNCSGKMIIKCQHDKDSVWVGAHSLPVFAQCNKCGYAPLPKNQPQAVASLLLELIKYGEYKR